MINAGYNSKHFRYTRKNYGQLIKIFAERTADGAEERARDFKKDKETQTGKHNLEIKVTKEIVPTADQKTQTEDRSKLEVRILKEIVPQDSKEAQTNPPPAAFDVGLQTKWDTAEAETNT